MEWDDKEEYHVMGTEAGRSDKWLLFAGSYRMGEKEAVEQAAFYTAWQSSQDGGCRPRHWISYYVIHESERELFGV